MAEIIRLDWIEPILLAQRLCHIPGFAFLDSAMFQSEFGRYSFVAVDPFLEIEARDGKVFVDHKQREGDPLEVLEEELARFERTAIPGLPPFQGGAIGYLGYDLSSRYEGVVPRNQVSNGSELHFAVYDLVISFDHLAKQAWIISTGFPESGGRAQNRRAVERAEFCSRIIKEGESHIIRSQPFALQWKSNFNSSSYATAVERVKEHIRSGDIFQANISQRFEAELPANFDKWAFYCRARQINSATFGAFVDLGSVCIASCSPERFLRMSPQGAVETRPIKGTIRRTEGDPEQDRRLASQLANSSKDRAENVMIVDLLRNDLSRSCSPESVEVQALCAVESYAGLHHLVSIIRGQLAPTASPLTLLRECFPGGSITGAPKIRAMEIIGNIEGINRGVYCGSIGYIGFDGSIDTNIAIRTAVFGDNVVSFNVGGGITLLSDAASEYEETLTKADRIFASFEPVQAA